MDPGGVDSIEHGTLIDEEGIRADARRRRTFLSATSTTTTTSSRTRGLHTIAEYVATGAGHGQLPADNWAGTVKVVRVREDVVVVVDVGPGRCGARASAGCFLRRSASRARSSRTPARVASLMLWVPCACAAMRRPALCASSTATRSSS